MKKILQSYIVSLVFLSGFVRADCYDAPVNTTGEEVGTECYEKLIVDRTSLDTMIADGEDVTNVFTGQITDMSSMFLYNETFRQDLSSWCVSNITSKPIDFDRDSLLVNSPNFLPIWGTCPAINSIPSITMGDTSASEDVAQIIAKAIDSDGTLVSSALSASHGTVTIDLSSGDITYTPTSNFSGTDTVVMSVTDNADGVSETITASIIVAKTIIVPVVPVNHSPTFNNTITSITITEGTSSVATLSASDADGDALSYSLSGDDAQFFEIDSAGVVSFQTIPYYTNPLDTDKNNIYTLTIKASDGVASTQKTVTITVEASTVAILNDSVWKQNISDEVYRNSSVVDNGIYATLSATKIANSSSSIELYQDNLEYKKEVITDVQLTNIDEKSYVKLIVSDDSTQANISINSQEAVATVMQNGEVVFTQNIYDTDTNNPFVNTRLYLNIWLEDGKVNFNVTDTNNNQIGRIVQSTDNFLIEGFTKQTIQGTIQSDANRDAMSFDLYEIASQDTLSYKYLKRFSHLEFTIDTSTYENASALDMNNTQFFEMRTTLDNNEYITLELNQINPYTDEILESKVIINHNNIITSEEKAKNSIESTNNIITLSEDSVATEDIKYQGVVSTSEMNTILSENNIPYTLSDGSGYKVYSRQLDTNTTTLTYFFDAIAIEELATNYGVVKTPIQERILTNTYNYVSLPSSITLCTSNFQTSLKTLCNQDYTIETLFAGVDAVFKYTDSWNYWTPDTSISNNNYNLDILGTLNNKEGFIIKLSGSVQTLDLPYNLYSKIQTNVISLYQEGWTLTSAPDAYSVSEIKEMVQSQGKTLKYILRLNDNVWNIYAPLTDIDVDQSLTRMTSVEKGKAFWIYVK